MFPYSFFRFPYYNYPHNSYYNGSNLPSNDNCINNVSGISDSNIMSNSNNISDDATASRSSDNMDFFEIFGLKLYFDDILLICIIFFLYNEGVKDQWLFISLILLLLS